MATISEALTLAIQHHQAGRLPAAQQIYRQVLAAQPNHADALYLLGVVAQQQGNLHEAIACYHRALAAKPDLIAAHYNLGLALKELGQLDEAAACYRRALELNPHSAEAHNNLGNTLKELGKLEEAVACYSRALELKPDFAEVYNNLGSLVRELGRPEEAVACCRRALELKPDFAEAHNNLGSAFRDLKKPEEAVACCRRALELKPDFPKAHNSLGNLLRDQGKLDEAVACYQQVVQLELGDVLSGPLGPQQFPTRGPAEVPLCPRHEAMQGTLGNALVQLASILRGRFPQQGLQVLRQLLAAPGLRDAARVAFQIALAQALDARGDYDAAAEHFDAAHALGRAELKQQNRCYSPAQHGAFVSGMLATFTPQFFARTGGFGLDSEQPLFIVGLPRSGTTLVEQILASHSGVFGAGELSYCQETFQSLPQVMSRRDTPLECLPDLDRPAAGQLARRHLDRLCALDENALRIVDKMPENWQYLGLIRLLFPRARVIHCRRELRDVALSCWTIHFSSLSWACDLEHIVSYFQQYLRAMDYWQQVLPSPPLDVAYEELVDDIEGVARRMIAFCGLEWEPQCLRYYETQRLVQTSSAAQVRRPVYKSSVGRWKNYQRPLADFFAKIQQLTEGT